MLPILILIQTSTAAVAPVATEELTILGLLMKGGVMMIPLLLLSVAMTFIFIERLLYIKRATFSEGTFLNEINDRLQSGTIDSAIYYCKSVNKPVSRIIAKGLSKIGLSAKEIEGSIENTAKIEVYYLERNLTFLAAIAAVAPMIGFLGTVTGMIKAFHNISVADNISIGIIAGGIYEKMITSASGLIIGVIAYILYTYLNALIDRTINKMEVTALEFVDSLQASVV